MKMITALGLVIAVSANAAEYQVSNLPGKNVFASGDKIIAYSQSISDTRPIISVEPSFHLDASQADGWTMVDGTNAVKKIPSLVGSRYLFVTPGRTITEMSVKNEDGTLWDNNDYWAVQAPTLEANALGGKAVLDFGCAGSKQGMLFDRQGDGSTTNQLRNIGTVIALVNSAEGGGLLLAGGIGKSGSGTNMGWMWMRGMPFTTNATAIANTSIATDYFEKWSPVLYCAGSSGRGNYQLNSYVPATEGLLRLNGADMVPYLCGYNGGWEVVSITCTNNLAVANGLGLGVLKIGTSVLSGGIKIAEMIIYPECLSVFELAKVEEYLAAKWLQCCPDGKGGNARLGNASVPSGASNIGSSLTFDVPEGISLTTGAPDYGRGAGAAIEKTGEGILEIEDWGRFAGSVNVSGGTLRFAARKIPSEIPCEPFFAIDASNRATYQDYIRNENGTNFVDRVDSFVDVKYRRLGSSTHDAYYLCAARNSETAKVPFLTENVFKTQNGESMPAFDFWDVAPNGNGVNAGGYWRFVYGDTLSATEVRGITTVFAVVNPRFVGGTLLGGYGAADVTASGSSGCYFDRCQQVGNEGTRRLANWREPLLGTNTIARMHTFLTPTNGIVMIDGEVRSALDGFASPGWQVLAMRVPGSVADYIGTAYNNDYAGGFMLAELALYNHALSEEEMRDVSAYLTKKWFNRSLPGYERTISDENIPQLQTLTLADGTSIEISAGATVRVGKLTAEGAFAVKGGGRLEVENAFFDPAGLTVEDESRIFLVKKTNSSQLAKVAEGASMHLDANDTSSMVLFNEGNSVYARSWNDKAGRNLAIAVGNTTVRNSTTAPSLVDGEVYGVSGRKFLDFGGYESGKSMNFLKPMHGVRVAYIVRVSTCVSGTRGLAGGVLLGENGSYSDSFDFACAGNNNGHPAKPFALEAHSVTKLPGFVVYTNGVKVASPGALFYSPDLGGIPEVKPVVLYELHLPAGAHVSALAGAKNNKKLSGCQALGEVILYERELSESEILQTRNYLMKKWFGKCDEELAPLPDDEEATEEELVAFDGRIVEGGEYRSLVGTGTFEKKGNGVLAVGDISGFAGTVAVTEGNLKLVTPVPAKEPFLPASSKILARFDASQFVSTDASSRVTEWQCAQGSGWSVAPSNTNYAVYETAQVLGGRPVVNISKDKHIRMQFRNPDGQWDDIGGIKTVLWLIESGQGGGFLLGDSLHTGKTTFHRGSYNNSGSWGDRSEDPILYSGAADAVRTAEFNVNGKKLWSADSNLPSPMEYPLTGGWDLISMRTTTTYPLGVAAGGLAWCKAVSDRSGSQKVAEIVIYGERLNNDEIEDGLYYLKTKWGLDGEFQRSTTNNLSVALSSGATLDLDGKRHYVASLEGAGSVINSGSLAVGKLVADFDSANAITYGGVFVVRPQMKVELRNLGTVTETRFLPIITVSGVEGSGNLPSAVFTGAAEGLADCRVRLACREGSLGVLIKRPALTIVVR